MFFWIRRYTQAQEWVGPASKGNSDLGAETGMASNGTKNKDKDFPPGFSVPLNCPIFPSDSYVNDINYNKGRISHADHQYGVAMGQSQPRFSSRLPISVVKQFGTYEAEPSGNWIVAPGMPFQPFPPLPSYPRDQIRHATISQAGQKAESETHNSTTLTSNQNPSSTSEPTAVGMETVGTINQPDFQRCVVFIIWRGNSLGNENGIVQPQEPLGSRGEMVGDLTEAYLKWNVSSKFRGVATMT